MEKFSNNSERDIPEESPQKTALEEVRSNVKSIEKFCDEADLRFKKPLLILGTFERTGSNWLLDTLNQHVHTHNEPFKQQLGKESVYSTLSSQIENIDERDPSRKDPFAMYWLETFVNTKYGTVDHAVKETNLFFAAQNFLKLFPDAPILVLKREPLGIISSFVDQDLFMRWKYQERYDNLKRVSETPEWERFRFVFEKSEDISPVTMLTRMLFLNSLILAYTLDERPYKELAYESSITDRSEVLRFLSTQVFPGMDFSDVSSNDADELKGSSGTFSTRRTKNTLESYLDQDDVRDIASEFQRLFTVANDKFKSATTATAKSFLNLGSSRYALAGRRNHDAGPKPFEGTVYPAPIEFIAEKKKGIEWRNTLVTNDEFCSLLNELAHGGVFNLLDGGQVFFNENMIDERGGRIHFDQASQKYRVSNGYENHPVYWVTWIGAMAFARSQGLRLPTRLEIDELAQNAEVDFDTINAGHRFDDVYPIDSRNYKQGEIHDIIGNLAVWCSDGPKQLPNDPQSSTRYIYGTAWNRPATPREVTKDQSRPLTGNSRAVGIRLVKDSATRAIPFAELADKLQKISPLLQEKKNRPLRERDEAIITLLTL